MDDIEVELMEGTVRGSGSGVVEEMVEVEFMEGAEEMMEVLIMRMMVEVKEVMVEVK